MLNGMMHGLINNCFWDSTAAAVRRLADAGAIVPPEIKTNKADKKTNVDKSIHSLVALIDDIIKNAKLVTRASMMEAEGLPYDSRERDEARVTFIKSTSGMKSFYIPSELDSELIHERHKQIDAITRVSPDARSPDDSLCTDSLQGLRNTLTKSAANFKNWGDKYVAHTATPTSRNVLQESDFDISLKALDEFIETACRAYGYISLYVLGTHVDSIGEFRAPGLLEYLDQPIASPEVLRTLDAYWNDQAKKIDGWTAYNPAELDSAP